MLKKVGYIWRCRKYKVANFSKELKYKAKGTWKQKFQIWIGYPAKVSIKLEDVFTKVQGLNTCYLPCILSRRTVEGGTPSNRDVNNKWRHWTWETGGSNMGGRQRNSWRVMKACSELLHSCRCREVRILARRNEPDGAAFTATAVWEWISVRTTWNAADSKDTKSNMSCQKADVAQACYGTRVFTVMKSENWDLTVLSRKMQMYWG